MIIAMAMAEERIVLKQAITPPHRHSEAGHISFCHPGYESPDDILFELPRLDRSEDRNDSENPRTIESTPSIGVHHRTALLACQIIADNAFEGYLATDRDGQHRVLAIPDGLLTDDTYWFIYSRSGSNNLINNAGNVVGMRHDLHNLWDAHAFALVPRCDTFAIHVLSTSSRPLAEFAALWHNVPVQTGALLDTAGEYLLAKFAQAVFMLLKPFIAYSAVHRLLARLRAKSSDPRHGSEVKEEWVSGDSLKELYAGGDLWSAGAGRKRSRSQASGDLATSKQGDSCSDGISDSDSDDHSGWYERNVRPGVAAWTSDDDDDEDELRGRPRKRCRGRDRTEHTVDTFRVPETEDSADHESSSTVKDPDEDTNPGNGEFTPPGARL